jgi:hypothetical protein
MPQPLTKFNAIVAKVRDWSAKREVATLPTAVIEDCLKYGCDDIFRKLRIPQLEYTVQYTIDAEDNSHYYDITQLDVPEDLIEFLYVRSFNPAHPQDQGVMYDSIPDIRTFLNPYAEKYCTHGYVWKDLKILIMPKVPVGHVVELYHYRRLAKLDAYYSVSAVNYDFSYSDADQPLLALIVPPLPGTDLYKVTGTGNPAYPDAIFDTAGESTAYVTAAGGGVETTVRFEGREAWNWLRDAHEQIVLNAALKHVGVYLKDAGMESTYGGRMEMNIATLNAEERMRRAKGGNYQINVNTYGLI